MADLPVLADRVNDIEVSANAPITESLHRKYGSNINYLLDFLGVSDGDTTPSGALSDFSQALELVNSHTMSLEASTTTTATGVFNVGTFNKINFINRYFYFVVSNTSGGTNGFQLNSDDYQCLISRDSGADHILTRLTDLGPQQEPSGPYKNVFRPPNAAYGDADKIFSGDTTISTGIQGLSVGNTVQAIFPFCFLDYRDCTTDIELKVDVGSFGLFSAFPTGGSYDVDVYMEYRINTGSLGF